MRLVTRADLDGLTSAILLQEVVPLEQVEFAHPKDVQDGKFEVGKDDILANLPYDARAAMWFDHHASQSQEAAGLGSMKGRFAMAPSAARVIADYYRSPRFERYKELLAATDRLDSAQLTREDIVNPQGWVLIGYTLDPRSGLGAFKSYFHHIRELAKTATVDELLQDPQVRTHVERLQNENKAFRQHLLDVTKQDGNVTITDVRGLKNLPAGNRFLIYDLFPSSNVSVRAASGHDGSYISIQVGRSILNRTCKTNVGALMAQFGGGGHEGAGTCQPRMAEAENALTSIVTTLKRNG